MRCMQIEKQGLIEEQKLSLRAIETPQPGPGQALIKVLACGVCHTDLHTAEGDIHPPWLPVIPGHQVVGRVESLGEGAERSRGPRPGDLVGVTWLYSTCGECQFCLRGEQNLCSRALFTGFHVNGGYAEYMLADARYMLPIPAGFTAETAAPLLCAGVIGYRSLRKVDLSPGERLGLVGFGASAHLAIQVARHWGCQVYVFSRSAEHRKHAEALGACWTGTIEETPAEPLDRAVIFAPAGSLVPKILAKIRPAGTLAINAISMSPIPEMPYEFIYGERTLRSVANLTLQDGEEFLKLAAKIPISPTVQLYPLEKANEALLDMKYSRLNGEAVLQVNA